MKTMDLEEALAKFCSAHNKVLLPCLSSSGTATKILSSTTTVGLSAASLVLHANLLAAVLKLCRALSGVCRLVALSISDLQLLGAGGPHVSESETATRKPKPATNGNDNEPAARRRRPVLTIALSPAAAVAARASLLPLPVSPPPNQPANPLAGRRPPPRLQMELGTSAARNFPSPASGRGTVPSPRLLSHHIWSRSTQCAVSSSSSPAGPVDIRSRFSARMTTAHNTGTPDLVDFNWDVLGFQLVPTDFMYLMRCSSDGVFTNGELVPYGPIELNPAAAVLNYGQGLLEGLRAHRKEDGLILLFRPHENALRMRIGADRLCMPAPSVEQFLEAVKLTVLANKRWVPPTGKGSLYIRPQLIGSGAILGVAPAPQYTFIVFVCPVGHYFKDGLSPISLLTEEEYHRAAPGGTGDIKTIGNYASVVSAQRRAKEKGHSDVLYLDPIHNKFVEEVSSCNIFMVKV
nr:unnamed protein product [Digitaria exilis]